MRQTAAWPHTAVLMTWPVTSEEPGAWPIAAVAKELPCHSVAISRASDLIMAEFTMKP